VAARLITTRASDRALRLFAGERASAGTTDAEGVCQGEERAEARIFVGVTYTTPSRASRSASRRSAPRSHRIRDARAKQIALGERTGMSRRRGILQNRAVWACPRAAGGRVAVRVLGLSVPAGMTANFTANTGMLTIAETANVKLATLKGKVEAFATVGVDPFSKSWYWTLFDWDGYERTIPLFNREETPVNVGKLMKRLAAPKNVSIASLD